MRAGGAVIADSENASEHNEGDYDPVIYFPRKDVAMAVLEKLTKKQTRSIRAKPIISPLQPNAK